MALNKPLKQNPYFHFAIKFIALFFIIFLLDFSIGRILKYFYFKEQSGRQYRATYAIEKTTADVLIFGSSRAYHHYVPDVIENKLNVTCYNTGSPGQFLLYNSATLKAILKRYTPKLVVLDLVPGEFRVERESYDRLSFLLPYYKAHPEIHAVIDLKSPFEKYKMLSSIYPYNSSFLMIAGGNMEYFKKEATDFKGYKPTSGIWEKPIQSKEPETYKLDSVKINIFKGFINDCRKSGTKLFVVCSPSYVIYKEGEYSISIAAQIAREQHVLFMDFTNNPAFRDHLFFDDPGHLNARGGKLFTSMVADSISSSGILR